ncbi:hypothetical protein RCL_jg15439.t1 [Rhizophagus clarus]|uniref:Uncharacterized protein n=1 Tax=Rhizophagus clarus TaxID=94130 RepID=A0A8H3KST7_9GLOM|nr:hypothetical protein RCL_jg15439.t1 [Rhizophagus clarus]
MEQTHKNTRKDKPSRTYLIVIFKLLISGKILWTSIRHNLPTFCIDLCEFSLRKEDDLNIQENETPYVIPKAKNKRENDNANANLEDQNRKRSKKGGNNLGDILQIARS